MRHAVYPVEYVHVFASPDSKVHGANMGPTWVLSAPDGPHVGPWTLLSGELYFGYIVSAFVRFTYLYSHDRPGANDVRGYEGYWRLLVKTYISVWSILGASGIPREFLIIGTIKSITPGRPSRIHVCWQ